MNSKRPVATGKKAVSDNWNWTLSKLKREDWDFRPEVCREDELESCWAYEYSREVTAFRNAVADSRKRNPDYVQKLNRPALDDSMVSPSIKSSRPMRLGSAIVDALSKPPVPLAYRIHPQWPETPFGLLKRTPRKTNPDRIFSYLQKDIGEFARELIGRPDFLNLPKTLWNQESNSETIVFTIPWNYGNDQLKQGFYQWLTDNRPQGNEGDSRPRVDGIKRPTGAGSRPRQIRASLKALGAYRLLLCYGGNRKKAREHTDVCKVLGRDFYNNESGSPWTDANRVALYGNERISAIKQGDLKSEEFRLKWETDAKFRQEYEQQGLRFYGKEVGANAL
ncbi:MAG: hypothetical protein ACLQAH_13660 [Limisphaerales bacterium]